MSSKEKAFQNVRQVVDTWGLDWVLEGIVAHGRSRSEKALSPAAKMDWAKWADRVADAADKS